MGGLQRPTPIIFSGRENSRDDTLCAMDAALRAIAKDLLKLKTTEALYKENYPPVILLKNLQKQGRSLENYEKKPYTKKLKDLISRECNNFINDAKKCYAKGKTIEERLNALLALAERRKEKLTTILISIVGASELESISAAYAAMTISQSIIFGGTTIVLMGGLYLGSRKSKEFSKSIKEASDKLIQGIQDDKEDYLNEAETILRKEFGEKDGGRWKITRALRWFSTPYDQYASAHLILGHIGMQLDKPCSLVEFIRAYEDSESELLKNISLLGIMNVLSSDIPINKKEEQLKIYLKKFNEQEDMKNHYIHTVVSSARETIADILFDNGISNDTKELLNLKNINFIKHIKGHGEFLKILFEFIKVIHEHKSDDENTKENRDFLTETKLIGCNASTRKFLGKPENLEIPDPIIRQILTTIEEYIQEFRKSLNHSSNDNSNNKPKLQCK